MGSFFVVLVMLLHVAIAALEMFFWQSRIGLKIFRFSKEYAEETASLAINQGVYNGILAAGLFWTFFIEDPTFQYQARLFFLSSIVVAGVVGGITAKASIFFIQALPALVALFFIITKESIWQ